MLQQTKSEPKSLVLKRDEGNNERAIISSICFCFLKWKIQKEERRKRRGGWNSSVNTLAHPDAKAKSSRIARRETKKKKKIKEIMSYFSFVLSFFLFLFIWFSIHRPESLSSFVASSSFDYIIYNRESRAHILLGHTNGSFFMARSQRKRSFVRSAIREKTKQQKEVQTTNEGCVRKRRSSSSGKS